MCKSTECQRCGYSELEEDNNYCPVCGKNLTGGMTINEVEKQIVSLIKESTEHIDVDPLDSEVFRRDKEALETVLGVYERFVYDSLSPEQKEEAECNIEAETIQGNIDIENISTSELVKVLFKKWDKEDFIKSWTKPLIEYLRAKHTSYTQIIVTTEDVRVTQDIECIPYTVEG